MYGFLKIDCAKISTQYRRSMLVKAAAWGRCLQSSRECCPGVWVINTIHPKSWFLARIYTVDCGMLSLLVRDILRWPCSWRRNNDCSLSVQFSFWFATLKTLNFKPNLKEHITNIPNHTEMKREKKRRKSGLHIKTVEEPVRFDAILTPLRRLSKLVQCGSLRKKHQVLESEISSFRRHFWLNISQKSPAPVISMEELLKGMSDFQVGLAWHWDTPSKPLGSSSLFRTGHEFIGLKGHKKFCCKFTIHLWIFILHKTR